MRAVMRLGADVRGDALALLDLVAVPTVALAVVVLAGVALLRGRGATAAAVVAIVLGAQVVTQLLKAGLARPDSADVNSLPSGHVTLVASLGVALVLVVPRLLRPLAATTALVVTATGGVATMVAGWHRPSDVLAALGVVMAVTGAVGLVRATTRTRARPTVPGAVREERGRPRSA
jgi:membrane-associated phospholipid phosphatase